MRILVVEDEERVRNLLRKVLRRHHYAVDVAVDGAEGEYLAKTNDYDAIILDLRLPRQNGWVTCQHLRAEQVSTPILMLTALDDVDHRIEGLDCGADDYFGKPFHEGELLARLRSLIRRQSIAARTAKISAADLVVDLSSHRVERAGQTISLTAKEYALLEYFILNKGKVLTRGMIMEHVWDLNFDPQSNVVDAYVKLLRQKIDKGFEPQLIHTVRGIGYRFSEEVES